MKARSNPANPRLSCKRCGKPLRRSDVSFCSRECAGRWKAERNAENRSTCDQCGAPVRQNGNRFCSKTCANRWNGAQAAAPRSACEHCGKPVPRKGGRFCSQVCFGQWKLGRNARNEAIHEYIPTVDGKNVELTCEICNGKFLVPHHRVSGTRPQPRFCSAVCFGKSRRNKTYEKRKKQNEDNQWRQSLRYPEFASAWLRANPQCSSCNLHRHGPNLVVHHIKDPNLTRDKFLLFAPSNLMVLCRACHIRIHKPRLTPPAQ